MIGRGRVFGVVGKSEIIHSGGAPEFVGVEDQGVVWAGEVIEGEGHAAPVAVFFRGSFLNPLDGGGDCACEEHVG